MTQGMSLHIGVNEVDPDHYAGWSGPLRACEADAGDYHDIAAAQSFETRTLLTEAATRDASSRPSLARPTGFSRGTCSW